MPNVTPESEIFDRLSRSLREAAEDCRKLAWDPRRGHIYVRFRENCKLVEGCCRQICHWREDARWLVLGRMMGFAHARAGHWLRNSPSSAMRKQAHPCFGKLAEKLTQMSADVDRLRHQATYHVGAILPEPLPGPHRDTRPVQILMPEGFARTESGLILPVA